MKKILLINPSEEETSSPHLGTAYIASYLESKGYQPKIFDRTFSTWDNLRSNLDNEKPDIVGIACNTLLMQHALEAAKIVKSYSKDITIVFGGTHPTIKPEEVVRHENVDLAVIGEGEVTFHEIVQDKPLRDIDGIAYLDGNEVIINKRRAYIEDIDTIPLPARHLIPMKSYLNSKKGRTSWALPTPATTMMCSRGCPFHCTFCSSNLIFGRKVRFRSPENVVSELEILKNKYNLKGIQFHDDTMTLNKKWLIRLCDLMIEKELNLEWFCNARVGTVDKEILQKIEQAGCTTITFGVESGNQRVLDNIIKKGITIDAIEKTFKEVRESTNLMLHATFMLGSPGETKEEIEQTISFAKKINPDVAHFAITIPFPGTELFDMAPKHGKLTFDSWSDFHFFRNAVFESNEFDLDYIRKTLRRAYTSFYLRPGYFFNQIRSTKSFAQLRRKLKGTRLLRNVLQT